MQLRFYKGDYTDILEVVEAYPSGGNPGDFVTIRDQVLFWHPERGNWIAEQHGIGSNAAILYTLLEMYKHLETIDDEIDKLWASLISVPTPTISDDGNGVVTIADTLTGTDIYYTTDGSNPVGGTKYTESFIMSDSATVKAIAVKTIGEKPVYSDVATKEVTVPAYKISESWGDIVSATLTYSNSQVAAAGGTTTPVPTLTVIQKKVETWSDGDRSTNIDVSESVTNINFASSDSSASVDTDGNVTFASANSSSTAVQTTITASFSVNGKTGTATAVVSQKAAEVYAEAGVADTVPTSLSTMKNVSTGTLNINASGKVHYVAIPKDMTISSWYDNDEAYEMKDEITAGETFTYSGKSYKIYYNQVILEETKNFTIKFA